MNFTREVASSPALSRSIRDRERRPLVILYSEDLNNELIWYSNGQKKVECQMAQSLNPLCMLFQRIL